MTVIGHHRPVARKAHMCYWFPWSRVDGEDNEHVIEKGERYVNYAWVGDDGPTRIKTCEFHDRVVSVYVHLVSGDGTCDYYDLIDWLQQIWSEAERSFDHGVGYLCPL